MEKQELLKKMNLILSDLQERLDELSDDSADFDEVELELLSAHAGHLSDYAYILKILLLKDLEDEAGESLSAPAPSMESREPRTGEAESLPRNGAEPAFEEDRPGETQADEVPDTPAEKETSGSSFASSSTENGSRPATEREAGKLNELFRTPDQEQEKASPDREQEKVPPVREQEKVSDVRDQERVSPVRNLSRSIGLNERYYFIKNLFSNDKVAFDQAITRIDMCTTLGEAMEYMSRSLSGKYGWSRKEEDARNFYELVKRRFI